MNIKITYNWLLEYLDTDADPYELQKYLSLSGPSIERIEKVDDDYVFDIEVTSNRVDMASVFGIALEAQAILPMFGKKARIKHNPLSFYSFNQITPSNKLALKVTVADLTLCSRFSAVILSNIHVKPAPEIIRKRLQMCDIKSINNVVDISNYLMLSLGQPTHMFDYDGIGKGVMILRESKKGEKIKTLDDKEFVLAGGDIVIEDGNGQIVDLCGIMGGFSSSIKSSTKNVVLFVQTYSKQKIRRTSMVTGQRTIAATYFEKGLDEERVEPTLTYGVELLQNYAGAQVASQIYDIYPNPYKMNIINVSQDDIRRVMGVDISEETVIAILNNLGFQAQKKHSQTYQIMIPSWRKDDIEIKEDIVEEIARVYGYYQLPNVIQPTIYIKQPKEIETLFTLQQKVKHFLKNIGLHEVMNYSMVSGDLFTLFDLDPKDHLEIQNTISEEIRYLRRSLLPSLIKNMKENQGKKDILKFFEIAKVYHPKEGELPDEQYKLSFSTNTSFSDLKGIIEALLTELNISNITFKNSSEQMFSPNIQAGMYVNDKSIGYIGQLKPMYQDKMTIKQNVILAELNFQPLANYYQIVTTYTPPSQYAIVKLDLTIQYDPAITFEDISQNAKKTSPLLDKVEFVNQYQNNITLRFYFGSHERNITESEAKDELEKIKHQCSI
ncbi:phenylalanine--tRNA ligase subunit beta [Candidatus Roizmanbacteria bacterium]|nr:phenylalanine--tRNA ligase subunit beta [Candidatus Roizmanbacteria bacterium]